MEILSHPVQPFIALPLPITPGSVDFVRYAQLLERIDRILDDGGVEAQFVSYSISKKEEAAGGQLDPSDLQRAKAFAALSLRCNIARFLTQLDYRNLSIRLADSHLLRRFCRLEGPTAPKKSPSKTTLQRMASGTDAAALLVLGTHLIDMASKKSGGLSRTGALAEPIRMDLLLMDSTCVELNIHFPTDWVLLRDGIRSLLETIQTIRRHGLIHRMPSPQELQRKANKLAMQMTQAARRGKGDRRMRKAIFRDLKKLAKVVERHGQRYRDLLATEWKKQTDLSEGNANLLLRNLDNILEKLPTAVRQAHERIIGERQVKNEEKLLSLYEPHARVYVRGKADAEVEFGLQLTFGEVKSGVVTYWSLGKPQNDTTHIPRFLEFNLRQPDRLRPKRIATDRGFSSARNEQLLAEQNITSLICPKDPADLEEMLQDPLFAEAQRRRAQTEARVAILKGFIGARMPAKGKERQEMHVAWAVLSHNLWCLARLPAKIENEERGKPIKSA